jgi:outer membrane protein assembly factor BamE
MTKSKHFSAFVLASGLLTVLSGCGFSSGWHADSFKPYVPEVVQGNFVSSEQRQALRPGMSRAQVKDILGTPLVTSVFHGDRWDYVFTLRRQGVPPQQMHLSLQFKGDQLDSIEGDELPSEVEFVQRLSRPQPEGRAPVLEASDEQLRQFPARQSAPAPAQPSAALPATYPPLEPSPR